MKTTIRCRMKQYIQPFERQLAVAELQVFGVPPVNWSM